jgi:hypothetical protein
MLRGVRVPVFAAFACLALAVAVSAAVSSCIGAVGIGDTCSTMGDCAQPSVQPTGLLVQVTCSLGRCHYECTSSSFCGVGSECVAVGQTPAVCTLPDESTCPCPAGLECGPDKLCHTACPTSPCLSMQTCMAGACIDNPFPDGGPGDTGTVDGAGAPQDSAVPDTSRPGPETGAKDGGDTGVDGESVDAKAGPESGPGPETGPDGRAGDAASE